MDWGLGIGTQMKVGTIGRRKQRWWVVNNQQSQLPSEFSVMLQIVHSYAQITTQKMSQSRKEISKKLQLQNVVMRDVMVFSSWGLCYRHSFQGKKNDSLHQGHKHKFHFKTNCPPPTTTWPLKLTVSPSLHWAPSPIQSQFHWLNSIALPEWLYYTFLIYLSQKVLRHHSLDN